MPEKLIESKHPLRDAITAVTRNGRDRWVCTGWTTPGTANNATRIFDAISSSKAISGMRGVVERPNGAKRNFTIRHDYDFAYGMAGKGYHVNVELPSEKLAFCKPNAGEQYFADCVQMLSQRRLHDGDKKAARWFMKEY